MYTKIAIIGGGPAGMAAAVAAKKAGVSEVTIFERDDCLGGILNQCIHNGFGLHAFGEELTGPEYARRWIDEAEALQIEVKLSTTVLNITPGKKISAVNKQDGFFEFYAEAIVLAMGCRERPRGALNVPGARPAGIFTAGTAQRFVNIEGALPGKEIVILGSGDIGLIMARRLTLEGARVKLAAEIMPYSGGLTRNIVQCLHDYNIPLKLNHTVVDIIGAERLEAVVVAEVDANRKPIPGTEELISCDTLLLSVGLIPENELTNKIGAPLDPATNGPLVDESFETEAPGVFACGNVLHVHDLADYVSEESTAAGQNAARYVLKTAKPKTGRVALKPGDGVAYTVPKTVCPERIENITIRFRVKNIYKNHYIKIYLDGKILQSKKRLIMSPGEMETLKFNSSKLIGAKEMLIQIEENK